MLTPEGVVLYKHRLVSSLTPQFLQCDINDIEDCELLFDFN